MNRTIKLKASNDTLAVSLVAKVKTENLALCEVDREVSVVTDALHKALRDKFYCAEIKIGG